MIWAVDAQDGKNANTKISKMEEINKKYKAKSNKEKVKYRILYTLYFIPFALSILM